MVCRRRSDLDEITRSSTRRQLASLVGEGRGRARRTIHGNGSDHTFSQVEGDLENENGVVGRVGDVQGVENGRELGTVGELDVDDGSDNGEDLSGGSSGLSSVGAS